MSMQLSAFDLAQRFIGLTEVPGSVSNPQVLAMLRLVDSAVEGDETAWCSALPNYVCWLLRLPRSKSLRARSWLRVGRIIDWTEARVGYDVVVLSRGPHPQPGPETLEAPGHVGFFAGRESFTIYVLGGNQSNQVSVAPFPHSRILGVRRLYEEQV